MTTIASITCRSWIRLGFNASDWATIIAASVAALVAAAVAVTGYAVQKIAARRQQRVIVYAEALRAVADYLEAPYLILRRDGSPTARMDLVRHVSEIQSRIALHSAWIRIHSSRRLYQAYDQYVLACRREAGQQMTDAWLAHPTRRDRDVPISRPLPQPLSAAARERVVKEMSRKLR